jgi:hypothetical protein
MRSRISSPIRIPNHKNGAPNHEAVGKLGPVTVRAPNGDLGSEEARPALTAQMVAIWGRTEYHLQHCNPKPR